MTNVFDSKQRHILTEVSTARRNQYGANQSSNNKILNEITRKKAK